MKGDASAFSGCLFDNVHVESNPISAFKFETFSTNCTVRHSRFNFNNAQGTGSVFDVSALTGGAKLLLLDSDVSLSGHGTASDGIFSHADRVHFSGGQVWLPSLSKWSTPAVFKGTLGAGEDLDAHFDEISSTKVAAGNVGSGRVVISNDSVATITPAADPCVVILCSGLNNTKAAMIWARPAAQLCDVILDPAGKFEKGPGGPLTNTSATPTKVMVSAASNGEIHINNRGGGTLILDYAVLSGPLV